MTQILAKNLEKTEKSKIGRKISDLIVRFQISPVFSNRILELYNSAKKTQRFTNVSNKVLLSICFYRLNLEEKLYISLRLIKQSLDIRASGYLSNHLRLYGRLCRYLELKPIRYSLNDHIFNICEMIGLGEEIKKKAINLGNMIIRNFMLPGEYRTCAITAIYFTSNFEGELLSVEQFDVFFDLISPSVLYEKIKMFGKYMKEFFRKKEQKTKLTNRERYFLDNFTTHHRKSFFRKFRSIKN